jgi:hypothetical protein
MVDYTTFILNILSSEWNTDKSDPRPLFIHGGESRRHDTSEEVVFAERTENLVIVSTTGRPREPVIGTGRGYRIEATSIVRIEGTTSEGGEWGQIGNKREFDALVAEVERILTNHRSYPIPGEDVRWMPITDSDDLSSAYADTYREDLTVQFRGTRQL